MVVVMMMTSMDIALPPAPSLTLSRRLFRQSGAGVSHRDVFILSRGRRRRHFSSEDFRRFRAEATPPPPFFFACLDLTKEKSIAKKREKQFLCVC